MAIITVQRLADADIDAVKLGEAANGNKTGIVTPRDGDPYLTAPAAIQEIRDAGGYRTFANIKELKKYRPTIPNISARDDETRKIWAWRRTSGDGVEPEVFEWEDTGKSDLDLAVGRVQQQIPKLDSSSENMFVVTDANGVETWLGANEEGLPTEKAIAAIKATQGFKSDLDDGLQFTDENGVLFDLSLNSDGSFSQNTKDALGDGDGLSSNDYYFADNTVKKLTSVKHKAALFGSSTMRLMQSELSQMLTDSFDFVDVLGGGKDGERIEQIANRFGAMPVKIKFENDQIKASGVNNITVNFDGLASLSSAKSTLATAGKVRIGNQVIAGTFSYSTTETTFKFARGSAGAVIHAPDEYEFIADNTSYSDSDLVLLNVGKNNVGYSDGHGTAEYIADATLRMFKHVQPLAKRVIVLSHFSNTESSDALLKIVNDTNELYRKQYGPLYFDMNAYLLSSKIWTDMGITPNATDLQKQSEGRLPLSLSRDTGAHLSDISNTAVIAKIKSFITEKGWY